ncbi:hypothetical protein H7J88_18370 [Mycolicibacterium flavescens]|uniref:SMP-30/Gluconolactonase/LRE-like region domain-containing protein n=1 Tax=Mycolicibacterium flavescens TaxID=1776 RepID=A0A1E3RP20_MYCFV|nr:hypothetical protein [Mycolicibacterium flavescens]MCV7281601.1 hypothetical protein [Mycolicibacterium flavescens]ODQ91633.1 hypothetical protein BHQ18_06090 [Mycolicibacterium flavescens]
MPCSPDGTRLYVTGDELLYVHDAASGEILQTIEIPEGDNQLIVGADGTVYAATRSGWIQTLSPIIESGGTISA